MNTVNVAIAAAVVALMGAGAVQQGYHVDYALTCVRTAVDSKGKAIQGPVCFAATRLARMTEGDDAMARHAVQIAVEHVTGLALAR